ncbi:MFS transporter [Streptomyces sp. NBC_01803]|uniref:MFS transporter n=1 Tax=Streptomyces sp. NBC_01803 TaxID=2975946 RepID=UPI002DDC27AB|nr:MFS transporter [Streptomyces sp. NBC_01803]WSA42776.1 MFS transporter [Streptomyces sp. NBC_01803]
MKRAHTRDGAAPVPVAFLRIATARGRWTLLATVLGSSVVLLASTVTNVALPHIGRDFGAGLDVLQSTVNAYMLTLAGLILLGGSLGDRLGRRRVFVVGVVWFAVASLLRGLAPNADTLVCGAGMLMTLRVGPGASYPADALPALLVMGTGMVVLVAPLTVTLLSSVDASNAGLASGINNAAARTAGLVAVAALPLLVGTGPDTYRSDAAFDTSFRRAMPLCAGLLAVGAALAFAMLRQTSAAPHGPQRWAHGWSSEPPLVSRFTHHRTID